MILIKQWTFIWNIQFGRFQRQGVKYSFQNIDALTFEVFDLHINFDESASVS